MEHHPLVMSYIVNNPWAITQEGLELVMNIAQGNNQLTPETLQKIEANQHPDNHRVKTRNGIGIMAIEGPIFHKANLFTRISGATSTEQMALDFTAMVEDDSIPAIVLDINSPGGVAIGISEMSELIYDARKRKPVYAYVNHLAASAAYWIASAATAIILAPTASVGSIGTILQVQKGKDDSVITFTSTQSPYKNASPTSKEGKTQIQAYVDKLTTVFIGDVAKNRGVTYEDVANNFMKGGIAVAEDAVNAKMADKVQSFEKFFAQLTETLVSGKDPGVLFQLDEPEAIVEEETGEPEMSDNPATTPEATAPQAQPTAAPAAGLSAEAVQKMLDNQKAEMMIRMFNNDIDARVQSGKLLPVQADSLKKMGETSLNSAPTEATMTELTKVADSFKASNILGEQLSANEGGKSDKPGEAPFQVHSDSHVMDTMAKKMCEENPGMTYRDACYKVEKSKEFKDACAAL